MSYFDEYRFNPSYGFDWDNTWKVSKAFTVDTAAQFYVRSDSVSGGLPRSSAASTRGLHEDDTVMLRAVPTWTLANKLKLAVGVAGFVRELDGDKSLYRASDHQIAAGRRRDADLAGTSACGRQYIDSHGILTPTRYVSGGPSDHQNSVSTGLRYQFGPVVAHLDFSEEWDHHPSGHEYIWGPGSILSTHQKSEPVYRVREVGRYQPGAPEGDLRGRVRDRLYLEFVTSDLRSPPRQRGRMTSLRLEKLSFAFQRWRSGGGRGFAGVGCGASSLVCWDRADPVSRRSSG